MKKKIYKSLMKLDRWLEANDYKAYDPFDGLSSTLLRPFTFNSRLLRIVLQQGIRRFPINVRPLVAISKSRSSKGFAYIARGYLRLYRAIGLEEYQEKARFCLDWLTRNQSEGYSGVCWGNHFDYQSRVFYLPKGVPTVVWTALIGHAFLDAYECLRDKAYLDIAVSSCEHIMRDLDRHHTGKTVCISYIPTDNKQVHNANALGASLLARTHAYQPNQEFENLSRKAIAYTVKHQRKDFSWYYGESPNLRWIDNFHTAYVLDSIKHYIQNTGDNQFSNSLYNGYKYWKDNFFLAEGVPKYYNYKTLPIDIQCCSQAIDTLLFFSDVDETSITLATKIAKWTIDAMQDSSGYFYYRRYNGKLANRTPTLHWGQGTMLSALSGLYQVLS